MEIRSNQIRNQIKKYKNMTKNQKRDYVVNAILNSQYQSDNIDAVDFYVCGQKVCSNCWFMANGVSRTFYRKIKLIFFFFILRENPNEFFL